MPKGPQGQKRKADVICNAVLIAGIATAESLAGSPAISTTTLKMADSVKPRG
jgi:hypothetical protein